MLTYEDQGGVVVTISDEAFRLNESEQRQRQAEILMWTTSASLVAIAGLVLLKIYGG